MLRTWSSHKSIFRKNYRFVYRFRYKKHNPAVQHKNQERPLKQLQTATVIHPMHTQPHFTANHLLELTVSWVSGPNIPWMIRSMVLGCLKETNLIEEITDKLEFAHVVSSAMQQKRRGYLHYQTLLSAF